MDTNNNLGATWRYSLVANIVKERIDADGSVKHGTIEFSGGAKVYVYGKYWNSKYDKIEVLGLGRNKKLRIVDVPVKYLENLRMKKVYGTRVLEIMNNYEFCDGWWYQEKTDCDEIENKIIEINDYLSR